MNPDYALNAAGWNDPEDVDWVLCREQLANYLRETLAHFSRKHAAKKVYGIVIERGQNWTLGVYLNTEEGLLGGPARFRPSTVGYEKYTDAQLLENLGRWYYQSWEFQTYEDECSMEVAGLKELHYDVFERLYDKQYDDEPPEAPNPDVSDLFLTACAEATALLERSRELEVLNKTPDFALRFYDANTYEWETNSIMEAARKKVAG